MNSPRPSKVQTAVDLGVELCLVDVQLERLRGEDLVLYGVLEGRNLALDGGGVAVEDELHQLRVLKHIQLEMTEQNIKLHSLSTRL